MVRFSFYHGLGDCSNAAHLFALYTRLGFEIEIECAPDKACLFEAAGCSVVPHAGGTHHWDHPPAPGPPEHFDHWSGNKTAWNVSRDPLPDIGGYWDRWEDLCSVKLDLDGFLTSSVRQEVDTFIRALPRPLILFAPQGDTSLEKKNLNHETQAQVLRGLIDTLDGSVILLDWGQHVFKLPHWRVRHLGDDWHHLRTLELHALIQRADLVIGCDSGVLHFARFSDTPALGIWTRHHPSSFALPRSKTLHVVSESWNELTRYRRIAYNIVECPGDLLSGEFIAQQAARLLGARRYVARCVPDTLFRHLVDKCRQFDSPMTTFKDRHKTYDAFFFGMGRKAEPLVVEVGCIRSEEDWAAGYSTYLLGYFLHHHGGWLHSVDCDPMNVAFARAWTSAFKSTVQVHEARSHEWLEGYSGPPVDILCLNSTDPGTPQEQERSLKDVQLALPHLASDAAILLDATWWKSGAFQGSGALSVPWLLQRGWKILSGGYQLLLGRD